MSCEAFPYRIKGRATATYEHMPFFGHRTQQEVREDEARKDILKRLGRG